MQIRTRALKLTARTIPDLGKYIDYAAIRIEGTFPSPEGGVLINPPVRYDGYQKNILVMIPGCHWVPLRFNVGDRFHFLMAVENGGMNPVIIR